MAHREKAEMIFCYGLSNGSSRQAQRLYQEKYPERDLPHHSKFQKLYEQLCETGSIEKKKIQED